MFIFPSKLVTIPKSCDNYLFMLHHNSAPSEIKQEIAPPVCCFEQFSQRMSLKLKPGETTGGIMLKNEHLLNPSSLPHAEIKCCILTSGHSCGCLSLILFMSALRDGLTRRIAHNTFKPYTVLVASLAQYQARWIMPIARAHSHTHTKTQKNHWFHPRWERYPHREGHDLLPWPSEEKHLVLFKINAVQVCKTAYGLIL